MRTVTPMIDTLRGEGDSGEEEEVVVAVVVVVGGCVALT